jgi:hypothetical protein
MYGAPALKQQQTLQQQEELAMQQKELNDVEAH